MLATFSTLTFLVLYFSAPSVTYAFIRNASPVRSSARRLNMQAEKDVHTLVLIRHGESTWNKENRFTGWADVPLSEEGIREAQEGGRLIREGGYKFDIAYTSYLKRAIRTLWYSLEELDQMNIPIVNSWRLNERHYGGLQGMDKQQTVNKHGKEQVLIWRRSYDIPPPEVDLASEHWPGNDKRYDGIDPNILPKCESLKDTEARVMVDWEQTIAPQIRAGKRVLIAAHGNTLRALVKYLDDIPKEQITELNIPTAIPLVYRLDENLKPIKSADAIAPLKGAYLGDQEKIRARILGVVNQTK